MDRRVLARRAAAPQAVSASAEFRVWAPDGIGEITPGTDLGRLLTTLFGSGEQCSLRDGDVVVVSSKIVSKAEGRVVAAHDREAAITAETVRVVASRARPGGPPLRIVENRLGLVMAAAGVDASNTPEGTVLLLPLDPDGSASRMRKAVNGLGVNVAVVVTDTTGRPWREGLVDIAIGVAGLAPLVDERGGIDTHGRPLTVTVTAVADQIAAAAELVKGKATGRPIAIVRGLSGVLPAGHDGPGARVLTRPGDSDMFSEGTAEAYARGRAEAKNVRPTDTQPEPATTGISVSRKVVTPSAGPA